MKTESYEEDRLIEEELEHGGLSVPQSRHIEGSPVLMNRNQVTLASVTQAAKASGRKRITIRDLS